MSWAQIGFQDASSPIIEEFLFFHDYALVVLTLIIRFVAFIIVITLKNSWLNLGLLEGQLLECIWTLAPALILIQIAIPSLLLLYLLEESVTAAVTVKTLGHQWYWSYEYSDFWSGKNFLEFDSYMVPSSESESIRLLNTDNHTVLPYSLQIRVLIGSMDVLHSWTVPSLGVKADACPGRLNQASLISYRPGTFFGQCSEICGANHRFIPICLEFVNSKDFLGWVSSYMELNE